MLFLSGWLRRWLTFSKSTSAYRLRVRIRQIKSPVNSAIQRLSRTFPGFGPWYGWVLLEAARTKAFSGRVAFVAAAKRVLGETRVIGMHRKSPDRMIAMSDSGPAPAP